MKKKPKAKYPRIRISSVIPSEKVHENKAKPTNRAKVRKNSKQEIEKELTGLN